MHLMLNHKVADDYVVSTGNNYSVKDFICKCLELLDFKYEWLGEGIDASVKDLKTKYECCSLFSFIIIY